MSGHPRRPSETVSNGGAGARPDLRQSRFTERNAAAALLTVYLTGMINGAIAAVDRLAYCREIVFK
jgi:hypothetical protein